MSPRTTITPLPAPRPVSATIPPSHHVGQPPASFKNPWPSFTAPTFPALFKTRFTNSNKNFVPVPSTRETLVQVRKPDFTLTKSGLKATWIGHASFLIETTREQDAERGVRILLDPVWSDRVGPYGLVGPVRFTPPPCTIDELPQIDAVCISHDHYDHLDSDTLKKVNAKENGNLHFVVSLGVKAVLLNLGIGIRAEQITELDWWDSIQLSVTGAGSVNLTCAPAQHQSGRAPFGTGKFWTTLWCSWILQEPSPAGKKLFFAGDTGYCHVTSDAQLSHHSAPHPPCPAFAEIGLLYGPFDLALLPIGCYSPRSVLSGQHSSPEDSIAIHKDVKSKKSIGMHYGAIRGGISAYYEPVTEPPVRWKKAAEAEGLEWGEEVGLCDIGETVIV